MGTSLHPPSAAALARRAGLSVSRLSRLFKSETGVELAAAVRTARLRHAAEMLVLSTRSVKQIADAVGFRSTSHFIARFRREFGTTPRQYRRKAARP